MKVGGILVMLLLMQAEQTLNKTITDSPRLITLCTYKFTVSTLMHVLVAIIPFRYYTHRSSVVNETNTNKTITDSPRLITLCTYKFTVSTLMHVLVAIIPFRYYTHRSSVVNETNTATHANCSGSLRRLPHAESVIHKRRR
jgi:hypothetical protein